MTDARWLDVDAAVTSSTTHFKHALEVWQASTGASKTEFQAMLYTTR